MRPNLARLPVVATLALLLLSCSASPDPSRGQARAIPSPRPSTRPPTAGSEAAVGGSRPPADGARTTRTPRPPRVRAASAIVIDLSDGSVLYQRRPDDPHPIASITKIMTALLVLEHDPKLTGTVRVTRLAARQDPTVIGLRRGERISVLDLMYGLLLWSGNDTAVALAQDVSGSIQGFLGLMNARARSLGLRHTHFASPNGLTDAGYSTARDVATLARVALRNAVFAQLVGTTHHRIHGPRTQLHRLRNINGLLERYPGAIGVKTGYTNAAGECVAGAARRHGHAVLAVVLGEPVTPAWRRAYGDTTKLLDYGFATVSNPAPQRSARGA